MMSDIELGQWAHNALSHAGMSQAEGARQISERTGREIDRAALNKVIKGGRRLQAPEMYALAAATGYPAPPLPEATAPLPPTPSPQVPTAPGRKLPSQLVLEAAARKTNLDPERLRRAIANIDAASELDARLEAHGSDELTRRTTVEAFLDEIEKRQSDFSA